MSIEKSKSVRVITERSRLEGLLYAALISPAILFAVYGGESKAGQLPLSAFQTYNGANAAGIVPGPFALYSVSVDSLAPTQMNEGLTEVGKKAAGLRPSRALAIASRPVDGHRARRHRTRRQALSDDGHHTFTALLDSIYGASNPTVYVDVIANYSNLTTAQFFATMQAQNLLLPLNDGVAETVNDATGAPIPDQPDWPDERRLSRSRIQHPQEQELEVVHDDEQHHRGRRRRDARPRQDDGVLFRLPRSCGLSRRQWRTWPALSVAGRHRARHEMEPHRLSPPRPCRTSPAR